MQELKMMKREKFIGMLLGASALAALGSCTLNGITEWERAEAKEQKFLNTLRSQSHALKIVALEPQENTSAATHAGKQLWKVTALGAHIPSDIMVAPRFRTGRSEPVANKYTLFQIPPLGNLDAGERGPGHPLEFKNEVTYFGDGSISFFLRLPNHFHPSELKMEQVMLTNPERPCIRVEVGTQVK